MALVCGHRMFPKNWHFLLIFFSVTLNMQINCRILLSICCHHFFDLFLNKGSLTRDFRVKIFSRISFRRAPVYHIWAIANCYENSRRYSQRWMTTTMKQLQQYQLAYISKGTTSKKNHNMSVNSNHVASQLNIKKLSV